jgi:hypothetical protein
VGEDTPTQTASRFYERFDGSDIDAMMSVFSPELETTDPGMGTVSGLAPFREYLETLKRAMPDARAVIERIFEAGDTVIVEGRFVGTFTGPLARPRRRCGSQWRGDQPPVRRFVVPVGVISPLMKWWARWTRTTQPLNRIRIK